MTAIVQSAFLFQGFASKSQDFSDTGMTQFQAANYLEPWAHKLSLVRDVASQWKGLPGEFEYEVSEAFGAWLRAHFKAPDATKRTALAELTRDFFTRGGDPLTPTQYRTIKAIT